MPADATVVEAPTPEGNRPPDLDPDPDPYPDPDPVPEPDPDPEPKGSLAPPAPGLAVRAMPPDDPGDRPPPPPVVGAAASPVEPLPVAVEA